MRNLQTFLSGKGIDLYKGVTEIVEPEKPKESTLKLRASFIKEYYNHKFTQR